MQEPVKIVVVMQGGMVQSVSTFGIPVQALVIDYDTGDAPEDELVAVPQPVNHPSFDPSDDLAFVTLFDAGELTAEEVEWAQGQIAELI